MPNHPQKTFKPYKDSGSLKAAASKKSEKSADYWGDIAIDLNDKTAFKVVDGLTVIRLSGWKRRGNDGKAYLSLAVNRYVAEEAAPVRRQSEDLGDDDIPF